MGGGTRTAVPALGKPPKSVPIGPCFSCFIWSRSGIANSLNNSSHPLAGGDARENAMRLRQFFGCLYRKLQSTDVEHAVIVRAMRYVITFPRRGKAGSSANGGLLSRACAEGSSPLRCGSTVADPGMGASHNYHPSGTNQIVVSGR